jgi:hypothetical protein
MPDLFSAYFNADVNKHFLHIQTNEDSPIFARAMVNSQPSPHVCAGSFNLITGLLIYANE